jgi:hypothetical protein
MLLPPEMATDPADAFIVNVTFPLPFESTMLPLSASPGAFVPVMPNEAVAFVPAVPAVPFVPERKLKLTGLLATVTVDGTIPGTHLW